MMNGIVRIGVIGSGRAGMIHAKNFASSVKFAKVEALSDSYEEYLLTNAKELDVKKIYTDYNDLINDEDIDAIVIATPTVLHRDIAVKAANMGKHILCEKPMAMNPEECDEMISAAKRNKVNLQIGFMRRFDRSFIEAKKRILNGEIGDLVSVKSLTHGPSSPQPWQYDIAKSNGPLAEVNSHDIDTLRWYTESEFKELYAIAGNYRCPQVRTEFPDFYDNVLLTATFANGIQGLIDGAVFVQYGYDSRVEILGTKGVIFVGGLESNTVVTCSSQNGMNRNIINSWRDLFKDAYLNEDIEFIQSILESREPLATGMDGKKAVEVVNAGNQSILLKKPIQLIGS
ncbi:MAG: Gfo/Idh/MocA family oxidoreductase [Prolixibacteraceae bacterium]|jgi:myo-inositol 2-dehydrogenase/D-chiro-inositol 1-dehydrogenase/scyllo-inositol 2-dehydrogenase (NAD+)|nr:Gfo/Idh/MocA family oxidoreductase [Prolixibacteraceae bacterium]